MLGDYRDIQKIAYQILSTEIMEGKTSHAYLFDASACNNTFPFIYAFIKSLLCPERKLENKGCNKCNLCSSIDDGNFPDIRLIEPDGLVIKKEQLLDIQQTFVTTSLYNNKRIYIIKYAENLHSAAANSMLKFLEEPEENIVAILLTKSLNDVMPTILSRCQVIKLVESEESSIGQVLEEELSKTELEDVDIASTSDAVAKFVDYYEKHGIDVLAHTVSLWFESFADKKMNSIGYMLLVLYYKDIINYKLGRKIEYFKNYESQIANVASLNDYDKLYGKVYLAIEASNRNKLNTNLALNLDNMIIEMERL